MSTGVVTAITTDWRGDTLAADVLSGATVLPVSSVVDFDEGGGWLVVGDSAPIEYLTVDEDANTVTLAGAVGAAYELGLPVNLWDPSVDGGGAQVVEYVATVELHDGAGSPEAVIPHDTIPTSGTDLLIGATVRIAEDEVGEWYVEKVIGREAVIDQASLQTPLISLALPSNQTIPSGPETVVTGWGGVAGTIGGRFGGYTGRLVIRTGADGVDITSPGAYLAILTIDWANNTSGGRTANLVLSRGGVTVDTTQAAAPPNPNGRSTQQVSRLFVAEGNETLKATVAHSAGANLDVKTALTNLQVLQVAVNR